MDLPLPVIPGGYLNDNARCSFFHPPTCISLALIIRTSNCIQGDERECVLCRGAMRPKRGCRREGESTYPTEPVFRSGQGMRRVVVAAVPALRYGLPGRQYPVADGLLCQAANAGRNRTGCASSSRSSRHSRRTVLAQEWHLPQQVPTPSCSRNCGIVVKPLSTAWRIFRSETLWQTQTIIHAPVVVVVLPTRR